MMKLFFNKKIFDPVFFFSFLCFIFSSYLISTSSKNIIFFIKKNNLDLEVERNDTLSFSEKLLIRVPKLDNLTNENKIYDSPNVYKNKQNNIAKLDLSSVPGNFHFKGDSSKKVKFISLVLPLIVEENNNILSKRLKLLEIKNFLQEKKTLKNNDQDYLEKIALIYNLDINSVHKIDTINKLLTIVDIIPNSIVLAQAANESGWGTSRFAKDFNALFGEYTFNDKVGVIPNLRDDNKKHLIKFFPSIKESISSYFLNINTHAAYIDFRNTRKYLRNNNLEIDSKILVKHLHLYAEDKNYVKNLEKLINTNRLYQFDKAKIEFTKS